ncbi:hypothetical protein B0T36_05215 [Nocardia donostiensis]|uniref:IclR family transcriptional regulator n=1 Tax=Nocardia donostiensis TaxID=1538463 RepID=UPI0009DB4D74|nr:IclR family transcriptional regulator [Nocardia donostiensis]OQS16185.1 hypothetical protein B0T36_05215 [Nocardia donostiensis]
MADNDPTEVSTLRRASVILDVFDGADRLNLSQVVARTGLPRSSVHRILERMVALRWLRRYGNDYELGIRIVELGSAALHRNPIRQAALASLYRLHRVTGCIVHLGVLDGSDVIYLEKIGGQLGPRVPSRVGGRLPAHSSAIGRALLAFQGGGGCPAPEFGSVRDTGIATEIEQALQGFGCIAAPIGLPNGEETIAAVSICAPAQHIAANNRVWRTPVRLAAAEIWREICSVPPFFAGTADLNRSASICR